MVQEANPVLDALLKLAQELPPQVAESLAKALDVSTTLGEEPDASRILSCVSRPGPRSALLELLTAWRSHVAPPTPSALAWALRSAAAMGLRQSARQQVELVWTGPAAHGTTLRRTDQALLDLIRSARRKLVVVTFAAYQVAEIREALVQAVARGVRVTFVVESPDESLGKVGFDPMVAMGKDLAEGCDVWIWPMSERPRDDRGRHGTLHAKCAVADAERLLVSSANLTGDAMQLNMELGVVIEGSEMPALVDGHFDALMTNGILVAAPKQRR